ncbi:MAG TPA: MFS transporter, partial [Acidothermales bacterium]
MIRRSLFSPVHRRLAPLAAASFFGGVALWVPVEKLFLAELGFTPQTIGVMAAAYAAVVPMLEIPSGILADRWSRRGVLLVGNAGAFLSVLVGGLSRNVGSYMVAALLLGVYFAMQSGTFDAIVYDTVVEETGDSERFESILGRVRMVESASLVLGALGGGLLAALTAPRVTYFLTLPFLAISTMFLVAFREPRLHETGEARSLRQHVAVTLTVIRRDPKLLPVAALLVLTSVLTQAVFEFGP